MPETLSASTVVHDGFAFGPIPYHDFIVMRCGKSGASPFFSCGKFKHRQYGQLEIYTTYPEFRDAVLSGYAFSNGSLGFGEALPGLGFEDMLCGTGIYTYMELKNGVASICHDCFGLGSVYYYQGDNCFIASNRLHLVAIAMRGFGIRPAFNMPYIYSLALFSYPFKDQSFNNDTAILNMRMLDIDSYIQIAQDGARIIARPNPHADLTREELLEAGLSEMKANVASLFKYGEGRDIIVDLTGGKDTRVLMGACLALDPTAGKFSVETDDIPNSQDLDKALQLASLLGLSYKNSHQGKLRYLDARSGFEIFRSFFMGVYNRMPACFSHTPATMGEAGDEISISGGAGELYRDYLCEYFSDKLGDNFKDVINTIFNGSMWLNYLSEEQRDSLRDYINESLGRFYKLPLAVARRKYYEWSRVRKHLGIRLLTQFYEHPIFFPLLSRSLYQLSYTEELAGDRDYKIFHKVLEAFNPILLSIDFWRPWQYGIDKAPFRAIINDELKEKKRSEYYGNRKVAAKARLANTVNSRIADDEEEDKVLREMIASALCRLTSRFPELTDMMEIFLKQLNYYRVKNRQNYRIMASRIFALEDLVFPLASGKPQVEAHALRRYLYPIKTVKLTTVGESSQRAEIGLYENLDPGLYEYSIDIIDSQVKKRFKYQSGRSFLLKTEELARCSRLRVKAREKASSSVFTYELVL